MTYNEFKIRLKKINQTTRNGVATLPTIIALGVLVLAIGIGISTASLSELFTSEGQSQSQKALSYAEAGAREAMRRIAVNKTYSCVSQNCYNIPFISNGCSSNDACAYISVSSNSGSSVDPKVVTSTGYAGLYARTLRITLEFDALDNGQISSSTWAEITN